MCRLSCTICHGYRIPSESIDATDDGEQAARWIFLARAKSNENKVKPTRYVGREQADERAKDDATQDAREDCKAADVSRGNGVISERTARSSSVRRVQASNATMKRLLKVKAAISSSSSTLLPARTLDLSRLKDNLAFYFAYASYVATKKHGNLLESSRNELTLQTAKNRCNDNYSVVMGGTNSGTTKTNNYWTKISHTFELTTSASCPLSGYAKVTGNSEIPVNTCGLGCRRKARSREESESPLTPEEEEAYEEENTGETDRI
ncbi:hypothetical protein WN48_01306 [Eufriesea mexicana]|uniref:Uncharacterized protein n=1 Tax=Eufriesea mexicana TaxID=516756 RepID=A0A310S8A4_9HYME|nr:hypothetical protein WN48_01306 [Eufriesea mexicana]